MNCGRCAWWLKYAGAAGGVPHESMGYRGGCMRRNPCGPATLRHDHDGLDIRYSDEPAGAHFEASKS